MAKKKTTRTRQTKSDDWAKQSCKCLSGKSSKAKTFNPGKIAKSIMATKQLLRTPSPSTTGYPISREDFDKLKNASGQKRVTKKKCTKTRDTAKKTQEMAKLLGKKAALPAQAFPAAAPTPAGNFEGIKATGWLPPDCTAATGPDHVLLSVNSSVAIYTRSGTQKLQRTLTQWFGNVITGSTIFDPKLLYDQYEGRFVLVAVARNNSAKTSSFLISVSATSDPTGMWHNYRMDAKKDGNTSTNNWADYPAIGIDDKALYISANMFKFAGGFSYVKVRVIPKAAPYSGGTIAFTDLVNLKNQDGSLAFTVQPCHQFGSPGSMSLVNSLFPTGRSLTLWSLNDPLGTPALSRRTVSTDAYSLPPNAAQKGNNDPLNTGDVRMLHAVVRDGAVWCAMTTAEDWNTSTTVAAIHWFQINATSGTLVQQGVYGASGFHYFYPAITPDANGSMVIVFSRCSPTEFASIRYTGRRATDSVGQLQNSALLKSGEANYVGKDTGGRNRWGDYAGISLDPINSRTVWFYSMYADKPANTWGTWVGSAAF
ncbi:MAG: hypothetical protein IID44_13880 [Planctomycetes bacterium]|nr:hypothetical protein [Planctomycetota bacterium]